LHEDIMIETVTLSLANSGGRAFDAYLARPSAGKRTGIVMVHDMFGLNPPIRYIAGEFARRGHAVLVPNMFWRSEIPQPLDYEDNQHPVAWERLKALDLDVACDDVGTAATWLRGRPFSSGKVAVVGFCGGGRIAFLAAARTDVDAAAALYGLHIAQHLDELPNVKCPLQIHYGMRDQHIPKDEIAAVSDAVDARGDTSGGAPIEVLLYPRAGHSFFNHARPTFDRAAKALAAERIEAMLAAIG
jgi:carboxymethylenebutenolidase